MTAVVVENCFIIRYMQASDTTDTPSFCNLNKSVIFIRQMHRVYRASSTFCYGCPGLAGFGPTGGALGSSRGQVLHSCAQFAVQGLVFCWVRRCLFWSRVSAPNSSCMSASPLATARMVADETLLCAASPASESGYWTGWAKDAGAQAINSSNRKPVNGLPTRIPVFTI